jgi:hypothetical protein
MCLVEIVFGFLYVGFTLLALRRRLYVHAAFFAWLSASLLFLGLGSLAERLRPPSERPQP